MTTAALLVGALMLFVVGAERLLTGVSLLAGALRIPPLIIGLTVVPLATSTPELMVSINAAAVGQGELAVGNVVGTNTFNALFILGILALVSPLRVSEGVVRSEVPIMIGVSMLVLALAYDGRVGRGAGVLLLIMMVGHLVYLVRAAGPSDPDGAPRGPGVSDARGTLKGGGLVILGAAVLALSAHMVVGTATAMATQLGMSSHAMGLTLVAVGTSLPELTTTIVAVARGEHDLAVGNVVGSNIFNGLAVLGITAVVAPNGLEVPETIVGFDLPVMLVAAVVCFPIVFSERTIDRWEGALLLGYYVAYVALGWLSTTQGSLRVTHAMVSFVVAFTVLTVIVGWARLRTRRIRRGRDGLSASR